jgi:colicin import membrane protein
MEKANQDPAVKEAHEQAAKAQQAAAEAQKKAREATDEAARKADPSVAPILEKIRKAMEQRQPGGQPGRQPEAQPRGEQPRRPEGSNRQPNAEPGRSREGNRQPEAQPRGEGNREEPANRGGMIPGLSPDEQRRVREAMAKANENPAVREAREDAAAAQRKAIEVAEDVARKADPSLGPLFEKMRKAGEAQRGRKQPE